MSTHAPFSGSKIALLHVGRVLAYLRDDKLSIPHPNQWDLPGGGAEGDESPLACALRELREEFAIQLPPARVQWSRAYPSIHAGRPPSWFFVGRLRTADIAAIAFGDEGQRWELMSVESFLAHPQGVPHLQARLRDYFATIT